MKKFYAFLALVLILSSCKNIQKMVDRGEYDKAIFYAAEKLHGKKKKKTKHVKALEEAYFKVNQRDLDRIAFLEAKGNPENYDDIYDSYAIIRNRQEKITPFIPLISKDGYMADFQFTDVNSAMAKYADLATAYHYDRAMLSLEQAELGDKLAARRAFDRLARTDRYSLHYKDKEAQKRRAHHLGTTRVILEMANDAPVFMPEDFEAHVLAMNYGKLNSFWIEYYSDHVDGLTMDYRASMTLDNLDVSPESEYVDRHQDERKIKDGHYFETVVEVSKDSLGNKIEKEVRVKRDKFRTVYAQLIEIERKKAASVAGTLTFLDLNNGQVLKVKPLNVEAVFHDTGLEYNGDSRALCGKHSTSAESIDDFPSDYELTMIAAENMKNKLEYHLRTFVF